MSQDQELSRHQQKQVEDYLNLTAYLLLGVGGVLYLAGLYFDIAYPGQKVIPMFALADEPTANSGLFVTAILITILGFGLSRVATMVDKRRIDEIDKSQEWELDLDS